MKRKDEDVDQDEGEKGADEDDGADEGEDGELMIVNMASYYRCWVGLGSS